MSLKQYKEVVVKENEIFTTRLIEELQVMQKEAEQIEKIQPIVSFPN